MTHPAVQAYLEAEAAANRAIGGANHKVILARVAEGHGMSIQELRSLVLDETVPSGAG